MNIAVTLSDIEPRFRRTLANFIDSWGLDTPITEDTKLVEDLEFDSIDVIQLVVAIETEFNNRSIGFQDLLMQDGRYVDDLSVREIEAFLTTRLDAAPTA